jgi:serine/threonine protein kinase
MAGAGDSHYEIFVSYSHADSGWIDALGFRDQLRTAFRNCSFWIDDERLRTGDRWTAAAEDAIGRAHAVVLLASPALLESEAVRDKELPAIRRRREAGVPIVFVPISGVDKEQLGAQLGMAADELEERLAALDWTDPLPERPGTDRDYSVAMRAKLRDVVEPGLADLRRVLNKKYRLQTRVGSGPISDVFLATDPALERQVAIKALRHDCETFEPLFDDSLRQCASVSEHPNVVTVFGGWTSKRPHHYVRQYVDGKSIEQLLADKPRGLPTPFVQRVVACVGRALNYAHERRVYGFNVKPSNVLVSDPFGSHESVFLCPSTGDQRLVGIAGGKEAVGGSLHYIPPEQHPLAQAGSLNPARADQYRLGMLAYEMLTGPLHAKSADMVPAQEFPVRLNAPSWPEILEQRPDCPRFLARAVHRMIEILPELRFERLDDALSAVDAGRPEIEIARESYVRILGSTKERSTGFFQDFYGRLLEASPEAAAMFEKYPDPESSEGEWPAQHARVREAILLLLAFAILDEREEPKILSRIAKRHGPLGLRVRPELFDLFRETLLDCVIEHDTAWTADTQQLRVCWIKAITPGIEYMRRVAGNV